MQVIGDEAELKELVFERLGRGSMCMHMSMPPAAAAAAAAAALAAAVAALEAAASPALRPVAPKLVRPSVVAPQRATGSGPESHFGRACTTAGGPLGLVLASWLGGGRPATNSSRPTNAQGLVLAQGCGWSGGS